MNVFRAQTHCYAEAEEQCAPLGYLFQAILYVYLYSFGEVPNSLIKHLVKYDALLKPT